MPLLGGIFGKKNKSYARSINNGASPGNASITASEQDSGVPSPTNSYVTTDKSIPSSPNGQSYLHPDAAHNSTNHVYPSFAHVNSNASSSKLRLPFGRKKSKPPVSDSSHSVSTSLSANVIAPPRPSYAERLSIASDSDSSVRHLRPPPSKSAIFAAYADPSSALSTRSLPTEPVRSYSPMQVPPPPVPAKEKRPSLFNWGKSTGSPKLPPEPKAPMNLNSPPYPDADSSFNLKSFRHIRPSSPDSSLVVPPARPRGASVNSDPSQRISVAAFREAQARRSAAGSPVPSFRSPSPSLVPPILPQDGQRGRASPRPSPAARSSPNLSNGDQKRRSTSMTFGYTSESDESTTSSEEESDDDAEGSRGIHRDETITQRTRPLIGKRQAKSEVGHGGGASPATQPPSFLTARSHHGHGQVDSSVRQSNYVADAQISPEEAPALSQSGTGNFGSRPRASASTSALAPTAAAKRASILASANASHGQDLLTAVKQATRHVRDSSTHSNPSQPLQKPVDTDTSDSDSDDDNAPLASLVPPRRPGSAMSSNSNTSLRTNGTRGPPGRTASKPLIDITELTSKKPLVGAHRSSNDEGFTKGGLLAGQGTSRKQPVLVESPTSIGFSSPLADAGVTSKSPSGFMHFSPPTSPPKEVEAYFNLDHKLANASPLPPQKVEKEQTPESRRDMLTERLAKLAKLNGKGKEKETMDEGMKKRSLSPPPRPTSQRSTPAQPGSPPRRTVGTPKPVLPPIRSSKPSPPDADLIQDVDDSILRLISQMGESGESEDKSSDSDSDRYDEPEVRKDKEPELRREPSPEKDRIAPIPIKQRTPQPSFSVMSRPPLQKPQSAASMDTNQSTSAGSGASRERSSTVAGILSTPSPNSLTRPRSSTLMPSSPSSSSSTFGVSTSSFAKINTRGGSSVASSVGYTNSSTSSTSFNSPNSSTVASPISNSANTDRANALRSIGALKTDIATGSPSMNSPTSRPRSSTMVPLLPSQSQNKITASVPAMPAKPFAVRRDSPASSTGGSSSGRAPLTPRDGSDIGVNGGSSSRTADSRGKKKEEWSSGVSGLGTASTKSGGRHVKRRSVSFDDDVKDEGVLGAVLGGRKSKEVLSDDPEVRRRERRRSEAKAAIELGNVINGPGPVVSDDDEDDLPINQALNARLSAVNPMMSMGNTLQVPFAGPPGAPAAWGGNMPMWPQQRTSQLLSPHQFMVPPPPDPNLFVAHQQAMMYAKQAYQIAVAQQAMAAAADEWDRNSVMGGSVYGGPSSNASVVMGPSPYGMMGMGGMGSTWSTGSMISPSVYGGRGGISSSRSEYGGAPVGGMGGGNWSSARSSYGESFGPTDRTRPGMGGNRSSGVMRDSGYYPPMPPMPPNQNGGSTAAASRGRGRTASQPASPRTALRKAPPSSWKADR